MRFGMLSHSSFFFEALFCKVQFLPNRQRKDKAGLAKMSTNVTDQLLSISRNLADTTQRSAETLETLGKYFFLLTKEWYSC